MVTPRVQVVQTGSGLTFIRAGKQVDAGFFGGGLKESVSGVPAAEEHASTYKNLQIGGFVFVLGSVGAYGAALGTLSHAASRAEPGDDLDLSTTNVLILSGLGLNLVGAVMFASAQPHFWDAINIHNDAIERAANRQMER